MTLTGGENVGIEDLEVFAQVFHFFVVKEITIWLFSKFY